MLLDINKLCIKIKKDDRLLIDNLSFSIAKNDKIAIIGEEGDGKSTILKCIVDPKSVQNYAQISGCVSKFDTHIGYLAQTPCEGFEDESIIDFFAKDTKESELNYEIYENLHFLLQYFESFGLDEKMFDDGRKICQLSGGEKVKIALIKILIKNPDLLIFDEPTNDVDIDFLLWFEDFVRNSKQAILFVSHDETLLSRTANGIIHIEQLKKKSESRCTFVHMSYEDYIKSRKLGIEKQSQVARFEKQKLRNKQDRWNEIYNKVRSDLNSVSRQNPHAAQLLKKKMASVKAQEKRIEKEKSNMTEMPEFEESIFLKFDESNLPSSRTICNISIDELKNGNKICAKNIKFEMRANEKIAIIGKNGVGKTTLLKEILKKINSAKDLSVGYMPQNYEEYFKNFDKVLEFVSENLSTKEDVSLARTFLGSLKFTKSEMEGRISDLSGGSKAKLYLAKIMIEKANILVLDEPTRNLSPLSNPMIREALKDFKGPILAVSHDRLFLRDVATKVLSLDGQGLTDVSCMYKNN